MVAIVTRIAVGRARAPMARALLAGLVTLSASLPSSAAFAAQTNVVIATPPAPAAPRLSGPAVVAGRAAAPFLYTVAASGQKPLAFAATGLPAGLTIAASTGTISGTLPMGTHRVNVTVTNGAGSVQREITLVAGDTLALTPPMGWNSYDSFGAGVTERETVDAATAQLAQLQPYGWNYVVVDYLWFDDSDSSKTQAIDANGRYLPSINRFPSATGALGFKPLADKIHALGLNFGIHIMRGIPRKTVSANSTIANSTYRASDAANTNDACPWDNHMWGVRGDTAAGQAWYDSLFAQYAAWEIDFVKVDDLLNNQVSPQVYHGAEVAAIRKAIDKTGRSIVLSLSPGPMETKDSTHLGANANMWRMVNDFWDRNGLSTLADVFSAAGQWQAVSGLAAGHWPDGDMLPLGYIGPRTPVSTSRATALSPNEQVSVMSLWSILPSPLLFGGNVPALTTHATGPLTLALLTNDEVIAVNQDVDGKKGKRVMQAGSLQAWAKDLSGGRKAVALFNRSDADAQVSATWAQLQLNGPMNARDLWKRVDLAPMSSSVSMNVPWRGAAMVLLSPPAAPGGDAGVDSGSAPAGDEQDGNSDVSAADASRGDQDGGGDASVGAGGRGGAGGAVAGADAGAQGGADTGGGGNTGGSSAAGSAGNGISSGGRAGAATSGSAGVAPVADEGCACRMGAPSDAPRDPPWWLVAMGLVVWARRRRVGRAERIRLR